ncbi:MAG: hypothetical protein DLM55_09910 [Acidimicrobiales bacterium]|nr:MAG: hypothetical protein DLM55_09910 [Acidimicrobiales bacterium]
MSLTDEIEAHLSNLGAPYKILEHEAVTTSADAARVRGVELSSGAKALLIKAKGDYALFVLSAALQVDWKAVKSILSTKDARLATEEELLDRTGLTKGSVPPFGNLLGIPVYVDNSILEEDLVRFNAASLVKSIEMSGGALLNAVEGEWAVFAKSTDRD